MKRGYSDKDAIEFGEKAISKLEESGKDLLYLLNQEYKIKGAVEFVGNHYLLSQRQRQALLRSICSKDSLRNRKEKEYRSGMEGCVVNIDGFNTIITLEVALSGSLLLKCMDGTIRDLAGLRGSYRMLDITETAILFIGEELEFYKVKQANFFLDAPVSNSGNLKIKILQLLNKFNFEVQVEIRNDVDHALEQLEYVITSDAIILDKCKSWINLNNEIINKRLPGYPFVDFSSLVHLNND